MANKITLFRGRSYEFTYRHVDSNGNPVSLEGCTVYFTVKEEEYDNNAADTSAIITKTVTTHDDATGGVTKFTLNDQDTYKEPGDYYFDVVVGDADGLSEPPSLYGALTIKGTPTNRNVGDE